MVMRTRVESGLYTARDLRDFAAKMDRQEAAAWVKTGDLAAARPGIMLLVADGDRIAAIKKLRPLVENLLIAKHIVEIWSKEEEEED